MESMFFDFDAFFHRTHVHKQEPTDCHNAADTQFGFKKGLGCNHAIFSVRTIVELFVRKGSTINLCAIDLSKAFDKVNLHALFSS